MSNKQILLTDIIGPSYYKLHHQVSNHEYTHYLLGGGRGSLKSSFCSIEIILQMMKPSNKGMHAVCFRKVADTLKDSVFSQLLWAIEILNVSNYWKIKTSPLQLTYRNGNKVLFRGLDDVQKIKSLKAENGYFAFLWFEELAEYKGMDDIRSVLQSVMRGGNKFWCFYSYNPPESKNSWVNLEAVTERSDRIFHKSNYLTVPKEWLGDAFITEAEHLKKINPRKYEWMYLGEPTGSGGEVFKNVQSLRMSDEMIKGFDNVKAGLDWGWSIDPLAYVEMHYDKRKKALYIYNEYYGLHISNEKIAKYILSRKLYCVVKADSAEQKSISNVREYGVRIAPCVKGAGSRARTMRILTDDLEAIYIDPVRCPNAFREFTGYELEKDRNGNFKADFPDKDDHTIDAVRYAMDMSTIKSARSNIY